MSPTETAKIVEAYDKALIEIQWIQNQVEIAVSRSRNTLLEARRKALEIERSTTPEE